MSKILIIEDEEAIADLEKDYLELSGFEVEIANRGDTGLQKAMTEEYDLIILDLMLPEVDGFDICKQVRQEKNTPIIMVSAKKDDIDKIERAGMEAVYIIELEKEGLDTDLYYVGNGNLIKTVNEVSKEKRSSYMPVASDIQIWIKQKYPDATIIEMDNEKGKLEVDILDGGKAKELIFQGNDWLSTSWEVSKAEVPSVVMETFRHSNFGKYRIDDIHFYETPNNSYYYFDLEQGNSEVHLSIDPTGNILQ